MLKNLFLQSTEASAEQLAEAMEMSYVQATERLQVIADTYCGKFTHDDNFSVHDLVMAIETNAKGVTKDMSAQEQSMLMVTHGSIVQNLEDKPPHLSAAEFVLQEVCLSLISPMVADNLK